MVEPRFPIERAPEKLGATPATAVRARLDVSTGGEELADAIAGMGQAVFGLGDRLYVQEGKRRADDAEMNARLSMVQFLGEIRAEDDVTKWDALFKKHGERVLKLAPEHKGGKRQYDSTIKKLIPAWQQMFESERERKLEDNMIAASIVKINNLEKAVTFNTMAETAKKIRAELTLRDKLSPSISRTDTEILLANVSRDVQMSAAENMAMRDPYNIIGRIKGGRIEGFDEITDAQNVMRIENIAHRQIGLALKRQRELREVEINAEQGRLMGLSRKGELTNDVIRLSKLDEFGVGSKDTFYKILDEQADAALKDKAAPFKESDPEVKALVLDKIRDPKADITPKQISDLVGKGLSIDDADRMIARLDTFKDPWFRRIDTWLKGQLGWDAAYEKFLHPEGGIAYKVATDQLFDVIETENLRGKDIYDRGTEIAIGPMVDYWEKVLSLERPEIERMRRMLEGKAKEKFGPPTEYYESPRFYEDLLKEMRLGRKGALDPQGIFK